KNLIQIQCALSGVSADDIVARYAGKMYGHLKADTADLVVSTLGPVRDEASRILSDRVELDRVLQRGAEKARVRAAKTLTRVCNAIGFAPPLSPVMARE